MDTPQAFSIKRFCDTHDLSRALFYKLQKEGKAPRTFRCGRRVLISQESAQEWRKVMTQEQSVA